MIPDPLNKKVRIPKRIIKGDPPEKRIADKSTEPVFHYSSAEAFRGIIETGNVWLSNAAYLNDPNELTYPSDLAAKMLRCRLDRPTNPDDCSSADEKLLLPGQHTDPQDIALLKKLQEKLKQHALLKSWYTASFSLAGDLLSQWRAYSSTGGYSIGFKGPAFRKILRKHSGLSFGPVVYVRSEQQKKIADAINPQIGERSTLKARCPDVSDEALNDCLLERLTYALCKQFMFFKSKAFQEEGEFRIAIHESTCEKTGIKFRTSNGVLVPYTEVDLRGENDLLPLHKVFVGPIGNQDLAFHSAEMLLKSKEYPKSEQLILRSGSQLR